MSGCITLEIANTMNAINNEEGDVREAYSGRCMGGSSVVGYTADCSQIALVDLYVDACEELGIERDIMALDFDSMGLGTIVY